MDEFLAHSVSALALNYVALYSKSKLSWTSLYVPTFHAFSSSGVHLSFRIGRTAQMNSVPTYWKYKPHLIHSVNTND